jgi:hypothetical protein
MALFDINELYEKKISGQVEDKAEKTFAKIGPEDMIEAKFGKLEQNKTLHFVSGGLWSLTDIVHYTLKNTGRAKLIGYSWSFTAPAAQKLIHLKSIGLIEEMSFLLDYAMSKWSKGAVSLIEPHSVKVTTTQIHAKGFVIWNDEWRVACITSMNFSNNPRIEAGVISTEKSVFDFSKIWVSKAINQGEIFEKQDIEIDDAIKIPEDKNDYSKIVYIIRGLPGSGKSTMANQIADVVCEDDQLFTNNGLYKFEASGIQLAIAACKAKFKEAVNDGVKRIAVANAFIRHEDTEFYINVAKKNGYKVFQVIAENVNNTANVHGIKENEIEIQRKKFEVKL